MLQGTVTLSMVLERLAGVGYNLLMHTEDLEDETHPIVVYLQTFGLTQSNFAVEVGFGRAFISMLVNQKAHCGMRAARRIQEMTDGEITVQQISDWDEAHPI